MTTAATALRYVTSGNHRVLLHAFMAVALLLAALAAVPRAAAQAANAPAQAPAGTWPRDLPLANGVVTIYQPQVDKWDGDTLQLRAAVAAKPNGGGNTAFGVIWAEAHTEVDRAARMVTLSNLSLTRIRMPTLDDNGGGYLRELRQRIPNAVRTIELDRLQASLAASGQIKSTGLPVRTTCRASS